MLPSWIRSRNCRPRFVYFFAIEITSRRFASTISFFARRAIASPVAMSRLTCLSSWIERVRRFSSARSSCWRRTTSSRRRPSGAECLRLARTCLSIQRTFVSFFGNVLMKSLRGMPAWRTQTAMISRSRRRTSSTWLRRCTTSASNIFGASFSSMNCSASRLRARTIFGSRALRAVARPFDDGVVQALRSRRSASRSPPGPDRCRSPLPRPPRLSSLSSSSGSVSSLRTTVFGLCGCAISSGAFGSRKPTMRSVMPALAALDRLVGGEQVVVGRRVVGEGGAHLVEAFLDALGDADLAFARQQLDRAHLAHVHAHRVGGAAEFGIGDRERGGGFLDRFLVRRGRIGQQQRLGIRRLLVHRDAHVVDRVDDVFDLLRIDDLGRQVVVDLGIGQVALFLAARDEQLQLRLTVFRDGRELLFAQSVIPRGGVGRRQNSRVIIQGRAGPLMKVREPGSARGAGCRGRPEVLEIPSVPAP